MILLGPFQLQYDSMAADCMSPSTEHPASIFQGGERVPARRPPAAMSRCPRSGPPPPLLTCAHGSRSGRGGRRRSGLAQRVQAEAAAAATRRAGRGADMPAARTSPHGRSAEYGPWERTAPHHGAVPRPAAARPVRSRAVMRGGRAARGPCCCPPRRSSSGEGLRGSGTPLCPRPPHRGAEGRARCSPPLAPAGLSPTITVSGRSRFHFFQFKSSRFSV